eukprot:3570347-Rhodomonas_salina.4
MCIRDSFTGCRSLKSPPSEEGGEGWANVRGYLVPGYRGARVHRFLARRQCEALNLKILNRKSYPVTRIASGNSSLPGIGIPRQTTEIDRIPKIAGLSSSDPHFARFQGYPGTR